MWEQFNMTRETLGVSSRRAPGARLSAAIRILSLGVALCAAPSAPFAHSTSGKYVRFM
jgi:hypothetical protein